MERFKKGYDNILQYIKNKTSGCKVYLCSSCPRGDTDIVHVNDVIEKLATHHGASFVDIHAAFYDNNDQLRSKFYKVRDWIHLSNSGVKRLLGTIHQTLPIVDDFHYCVHQQVQETTKIHRYQNDNRNETNPKSHQQRSSQQRKSSSYTSQHFRVNREMNHQQRNETSGHHQQENRYYSHYTDDDRAQSLSAESNSYVRPHTQYDRRERLDQGHQPYNQLDRQQHQNNNQHNSDAVTERCMKCGLTNHRTYQCHHKKQLLCYACNYYGHKDSVCWNI